MKPYTLTDFIVLGFFPLIVAFLWTYIRAPFGGALAGPFVLAIIARFQK